MSQITLEGPQNHVSEQIASLRELVDALVDGLYSEQKAELEPHQTRSLERNDMARASMEMTVVHACDRLDRIIQSDKNWTTLDKSMLGRELRKNGAEYRRLLEAQKKLAIQQLKPHNVFLPRLTRPHGGFMAVYDGIHFQVVGRGLSLNEALQDYNDQFDIRISKEQRDQELTALRALQSSVQSKPRKKKQ